MKRLLLLLFVCVVFTAQCAASTDWHKTLDAVQTPACFNEEWAVYFKYRQAVDGYTICGKLFPFDARSETGYVVLAFTKQASGRTYLYISPEKHVYTSGDIYDMVFDRDFEGYVAGREYVFDYTAPSSPRNMEKVCCPVDELHPLGFYTPFQFLDVDFDGKKELLLSDFSDLKGGNIYTVFRLSPKGGLVEMNDAPFDKLTNSDMIDSRRKTITCVGIDGVFEYVECRYALKTPGSRTPDTFPAFRSWLSESQTAKRVSPRFRLVSVYEKVNDKEYRYNF